MKTVIIRVLKIFFAYETHLAHNLYKHMAGLLHVRTIKTAIRGASSTHTHRKIYSPFGALWRARIYMYIFWCFVWLIFSLSLGSRCRMLAQTVKFTESKRESAESVSHFIKWPNQRTSRNTKIIAFGAHVFSVCTKILYPQYTHYTQMCFSLVCALDPKASLCGVDTIIFLIGYSVFLA